MAITIFSQRPGLITSFEDPALPAVTTLRMDNWGGFQQFKSIVTRINVSSQGNFQFLHTLGGSVYIYVFGDKIGQLSLVGLAFDSTCDEPDGTIGIERILDYYNNNRVAARALPVKITIGVKTTFLAYLTAVSGDLIDPQSRTYQYSLQFVIIPQSTIPCKTIKKKKDKEGDGVVVGGDGGGVGVDVTVTEGESFVYNIGSTTVKTDGSLGPLVHTDEIQGPNINLLPRVIN